MEKKTIEMWKKHFKRQILNRRAERDMKNFILNCWLVFMIFHLLFQRDFSPFDFYIYRITKTVLSFIIFSSLWLWFKFLGSKTFCVNIKKIWTCKIQYTLKFNSIDKKDDMKYHKNGSLRFTLENCYDISHD